MNYLPYLLALSALLWSPVYSEEWCLLWQDDFNENVLDESIWDFEAGDGCQYGINLCGWGNNELQWYTGDEVNARVENGNLVISVLKTETDNGKTRYTSARIRTKNRKDWNFGKVEIRAKIPKGKGIWPGIWMLPTNSSLGDWPRSGEIDIMELKGHKPNSVHMTAHFGEAWNNKSQKSIVYTLTCGDFSQDYHVFKIEWKENKIEWFIDDESQMTLTNDDVGDYVYPFNEYFHLLINIAVGGHFGGSPDNSTVFPQMMYVDYVKVHQLCNTSN